MSSRASIPTRIRDCDTCFEQAGSVIVTICFHAPSSTAALLIRMVESLECTASTASIRNAAASKTTSSSPLASSISLLLLPLEIIQHILSFLDFPSLENFRHTSHSCMTFPLPSLLDRTEQAYRLALFEKEKKHAREGEESRHLQANMSCPNNADTLRGFNNLHKNPITRADRLHCFSCYSYLDRDQFTRGQTTGRRSCGHSEARKRFCVACGFRQKKWSRTTCFRGRLLPCVICQKIAQTDKEAWKLDLCSDCFKAHGPHPTEAKGEGERGSMTTEAIVEPASGSHFKNTDRDIWHLHNLSGQQKLDRAHTKPTTTAPVSEETRTCRVREDDGQDVPSHTEISKRAERCVRCWMIDHSFQPALFLGHTAERLCESCWISRMNINTLDCEVPEAVPETTKALMLSH